MLNKSQKNLTFILCNYIINHKEELKMNVIYFIIDFKQIAKELKEGGYVPEDADLREVEDYIETQFDYYKAEDLIWDMLTNMAERGF